MKPIIVLLSVLTVATCNPYSNYMSPAYQIQNAPQQINNKAFLQVDTPEIFASTPSPLLNPNKTPEYTDFLKALYRFDKEKSPTTFLVEPSVRQQYQNIPSPYTPTQSYNQQPQTYIQPPQYNPNPANPNYYQGIQSPNHSISKRAIIFRPIFVYRKQSINRQKIREQQQQKQQETVIAPSPQPPLPSRRPSPSLYYGQTYGRNYPNSK